MPGLGFCLLLVAALSLLDRVSAAAATLQRAANGTVDCTGVKAISPKCQSSEVQYLRDFFYVGGRYLDTSAGNITVDQLYVEKLTPVGGVTQPHPLIFFHGTGPSGATWLNTPDNRKGFASYFIEAGYQVYLLDHISVGRASENDMDDFPATAGSSAETVMEGFTDPEAYDLYPESRFHTQWPGAGRRGDPYFEQFQRTMAPYTSNITAMELTMRRAGCELLELIGEKSYLVSHSAGALFPVLLSNDCPARIQASVNLEPATLPFGSWGSTVGAFTPGRLWGLTNTRLDYDPPIANYTELEVTTVGNDTLGRRQCHLQATGAGKTVHTLPKVSAVRYVAFTGQGSIHMAWDHCVIDYLRQTGGEPEWILLADLGIYGNGHFGFLERNNAEIARAVEGWMRNDTARA